LKAVGASPSELKRSPTKEANVLTTKHLTVLRAALQYFQDELVPHGLDALRPYLDRPIDGGITSADVRQLQQFLRDAEIQYAAVSSAAPRQMDSTLYMSLEAASAGLSDDSRQVDVVLIMSAG
jgi:hypothetical protein